MATFIATIETPLSPDPNFPSGYQYQGEALETFDWTGNLYYAAIDHSSTTGGIAITDLTTMTVTSTTTLAQMYASTSYGQPPGSPPSQVIYDIASGPGTDLYMLMDNGLGHGVPGEFCRFTRVDPATMIVTGEYYLSAGLPPPIDCVAGTLGVVNTTATNTIVAYLTNAALSLGPQIMDGTGMNPIGLGPAPSFSAGTSNLTVIPGKMLGDGSCDFLMLNSDPFSGGGSVEIWRVNVKNNNPAVWQALHPYLAGAIIQPTAGSNTLSFLVTTPGTSGASEPVWNTMLGGSTTDGTVTWETISGLTITNTLTGTVSVSSVITPVPHLFIVQSNYDTTHDTILLWLTNSSDPKGPPLYLMSVNYDGSINWTTLLATTAYNPFSRGASRLTGNSLIIGNGANLKLIETSTGAVQLTGSVPLVSGSFFNVFDAQSEAYYTFALASGFARITIAFSQGPFVMRPSR